MNDVTGNTFLTVLGLSVTTMAGVAGGPPNPPIYGDLKTSLSRIHDVTGDLRRLIEYIDSDWYYRMRYREPGEGTKSRSETRHGSIM
jgi:hypothetical protein